MSNREHIPHWSPARPRSIEEANRMLDGRPVWRLLRALQMLLVAGMLIAGWYAIRSGAHDWQLV